MGDDSVYGTNGNEGGRYPSAPAIASSVCYTLILNSKCGDETIEEMKASCEFETVPIEFMQYDTAMVFLTIVGADDGIGNWYEKKYVIARFDNEQHAKMSITTLKLAHFGVYLTAYRTPIEQIVCMHNTIALKGKIESISYILKQLEHDLPRFSKEIRKTYHITCAIEDVHELSSLHAKCDQDAALVETSNSRFS